MSIDFLWGDRPVRTRGPKPSMTLDRIAGAAVAIADAEGLAAASMQRVAGELGVTKMALYRYLPGRTELVALMVERTLGPPPGLTAGDWRTALTRWAGRLLDGYLEHPWLLNATVGARPIGPHELAWMEAALAALAGTPLTAGERLDTLAVLTGQARMFARAAGRLPAAGGAVHRRDRARRHPVRRPVPGPGGDHGGRSGRGAGPGFPVRLGADPGRRRRPDRWTPARLRSAAQLIEGAVHTGCGPVAAPTRSVNPGRPVPILRGMEPLASVSLATTGGSRTAGWQMQLRVDYVVNQVMQTHRGQSEDAVRQAISEQLRSFGVVPNGRQIAHYATVISQLPQLPPRTGD